MKVKNFGVTPISLVIAGVRYQFAPDAVLEFEDKDELIVDAAIKIYDDLKVVYENKEEEILTDAFVADAIAAHDVNPSAHSGQISGAIADHVAESDPHTQYQKESEKGQPNGYVGTDGGNKIPVEHLPNSVMTFHDFWNAATNTPPLADGIGNAGQVYEVEAGGAGTQDLGSGSQTFEEGDWVVYTGTGIWKKSLNSAAAIPDASPSVAGKVNTVAQTFAGVKSFQDGAKSPVAPSASDDLVNKAFIDSKLNGNLKLITAGIWSWSVSNNSSIVDSEESNAGNGAPFNKYTAIPFTLAQETTLNNVELRLRQFSGAASFTIDVVSDLSGDPDETDVLATSGLGNVTLGTFDWIPFSLPNTVLPAGTYWLVFTLPNSVAIEFSNANQAKVSVDAGATWNLDSNNNVLFKVYGSTETSSLELTQDAFVQIAGLSDTSNKISPFTDSLADGEVLWVTLNKTNTPQTLTVNKDVITAVENDPNKFILVRRIGTKIFVSDDFFVQAATDTEQGLVSISAQTFGGHKTFKDGLTSQEEIIISSTLNPYASIRTASVNGDSQKIIISSGDSVTGDSGDVLIASGTATKTAPSNLVIQGVTFSPKVAVGKSTHLMSVQIIVDDTNITNPAAPSYNTRGSSGQRLEIRVNSATTVDQLIAAFPVSGNVFNNFNATGSGLTTFTNDVQYFSGAKDTGQTIIASDYQVRVESGQLMLGESDAPYGQIGIVGADVSGTQSSDTLFILSGRVKGTGNSGGISMRTNDMEGSGASGSTFIRTGSVNGTLASGSTTISTGATTQFSTANTGSVNINSGSINGISGNSGNVFVSSGAFATTTQTGTTGQVQIFTGNYAGSGSVSGGLLFIGGAGFTGAGSGNTSALSMRSGDKTNAASTGNTGTVILRSGNHAGTGNSGTLTLLSGNINVGNSGQVEIGSGGNTGTSGNTGNMPLHSGLISGANIGGSTGYVSLYSGLITNASATGNTGDAGLSSGNNAGSGNTGNVTVASGTAVSGNSGNINISTGTAGGARGNLGLSANVISLNAADNINLVHGATNKAVYIAGSSYGLFMQTQDTPTFGGYTAHSTIGMSNFQDKVNMLILAGSDSPTVSTGHLLLCGGFASQGANNGGNVEIHSGGHTSTGNGGNIKLVLNGATKGKIYFQDGSEGTVGHVWTQTHADGRGAWQAVSGGGSGWTGANKTVSDNGQTTSNNQEIYADTSGGAFTLLLPASPSTGHRVRFFDSGGVWATNNLTIDRNGNTICGAALNFSGNTNKGALEFVYTGTTWVILNNNQ